MTPDLAALAGWLARHLATERVELDQVVRHTEGFSWETYTLRARFDGGAGAGTVQRGFAVRVEPADGLLAPYDVAAQYRLHKALAATVGVPLPEPLWLETDPSVLGRPFYVMSRVEGTVPVQWGNGGGPLADPAARAAVGGQFVDVLAAIHAAPIGTAAGVGVGVGVDGDGGTAIAGAVRSPQVLRDAVARGEVDPGTALAAARAEVEHWARYYADAVLVPLPVVGYALGWLRANTCCSGRIALCHGDYRIGNFILDGAGRIAAVLDWELAHLGDPVEDLAWAALPLFRGRDRRMSQLIEPGEAFSRYEALTGLHVEPAVFRFWTVLGLVKATASYVRACRAFEDGRAGDLRLAAMGLGLRQLLAHLWRELQVYVEDTTTRSATR